MKEIENVIFEKNAIKKMCDELKSYNRIFVLTSPTPKQQYFPILSNMLSENKLTFWSHTLPQNALCNSDNVLKACSKVNGAQIIVALGAGTVADIAKIVSKKLELPLFVLPTTITHYGVFNNVSILTDVYPKFIETPFPKKVFLDENIIHKSPEKFINSTLCFSISLLEHAFFLEANNILTQENNVNILELKNKIKKIEELTGWLALSKSFAILNLMDYVFDLSQILLGNYKNSSVIFANMLKCSTLKNNFGEKILLSSQVLLKTYLEFFKQKIITPKNIPNREKILFLLTQKPITSTLKTDFVAEDCFNNFIYSSNKLLNQKLQFNLQKNRIALLGLCQEKQSFISKFLKKVNLTGNQSKNLRMINENQLFESLQLLPLFSPVFLPKILSRFGYLDVV